MKQRINAIKERDAVMWVNIMLVGVVSLLLFYYVVMANSITSKSYRIQALRDRVSYLNEKSSAFMSERLVLESPAAILEFAKASNFVEARNVSYIFENNNVALQR